MSKRCLRQLFCLHRMEMGSAGRWVLAGVRHDAIYTQGCSLLCTLTRTRWHTSFAVFIFEVVQLQLGYSSTAKY